MGTPVSSRGSERDDLVAVSDADFEHLRRSRGFADRTFVELVYVVNVVSGYDRLTLAVDLDYDHEFPEEWAREAVSAMTPMGPATIDRSTHRSSVTARLARHWTARPSPHRS